MACEEGRLSDAEIEGTALAFLREIDLLDEPAPDLHEVAILAGYRVIRRVPGGHAGFVDHLARRIGYSRRGSAGDAGARLAHELGHVALVRAGYTRHQEADADAAGLAVAMPSWGVRMIAARDGLAAPALLAAWPHLPPILVLARVAAVTELVAIVHAGGRRVVSCPAHREVVPAIPGEEQLVARARASGLPVRSAAATAWPIAGGVAVLSEVG